MATDMGKLHNKKEHYLAHNLKKRCTEREFTGIHNRFLRDHVFRERMLENNRDDDVCRGWDDLAEEDHTCRVRIRILSLEAKLVDLYQ